MTASIFQAVLQAQQQFQQELLNKRNVVGVAVGYRESQGQRTDEPAVAVLVEKKVPESDLTADDLVPREVNGVRTDVFEVGTLRALQSTDSPRGKFRPIIPAGVSIGHYKVTAGTLGAVVRDRATGERFLLSNNHVLANCNEAEIGDPIYQPAPLDGGTTSDKVATLERFISLKYLEGQVGTQQPMPVPTPPDPKPTPNQPTGCNLAMLFKSLTNIIKGLSGSSQRVESPAASQAATAGVITVAAASESLDNLLDVALARPLNADMFSPNIRHIGTIQGTKAPAIGMKIRKAGRTTDYTESTITLLNATVNVKYNTSQEERTARFTGQVICDVMSQGGDSGALIVEQNSQNAVGLLFGGSTLATIFTPIDVIMNTLNITF
ncbi:MAG: hypothetical protein Kow00117_05070 [Phototrophicales bacterium]